MSPDIVPATGRIGVLLVNLGTPELDRLLGHAALFEGVSVGPPGH